MEEGGVGGAHGAVGGQLDGGALGEGPRRHDDGVVIAGHVPRLGGHVGIHGRACLDAAAEGAEPLGGACDHRLDDVVAHLVPRGLHGVAQGVEDVGRQVGGLEGLGGGVGGIEQALVEGLVVAVKEAGESLKKYFPYQSDDINEQPDEVSFGE